MGVSVSKQQSKQRQASESETRPDTTSPSEKTNDSGSPPSTSGSKGKQELNGSAAKEPKHYSKAPPPPKPPSTCKDEVFSLDKYVEVDKHALTAPSKLMEGTFRELVNYLTSKSDWDDLAKIRAIFLWVTSVDVYGLEIENPPSQSPLEYFSKIQNNTGNHAHLFSGLCQMANIPCTIVSGMNKSAAYEIGKPANRKAMAAQWNAVYCGSNWRFVDAFWASACVVGRQSGEWALVDSDGTPVEQDEDETEGETQHRINEFYFLTDPDKLIWTHYPDEKKWQLLHKPVSLKEFEDHFYVRERFYLLGMGLKDDSIDKCIVKTIGGERDMNFKLPSKNSYDYRFKYMLYQSRKQKNNESDVNVFLDRFVFFEHTVDLLHFQLRFPIKGDFKMDIYGLDVNESETFDLCCTYIIRCPEPKDGCLPFPDCPPLGWGPIGDTKKVGLKPESHETGIVDTADGNVEIRFRTEKTIQLHQNLKHSLLDDATLSRYAISRQQNGEAIVNLRLPQKGEYALKLFAQDKDDEGEAPNVCNYLIRCGTTDPSSQAYPNMIDGSLGKSYLCDKLGIKPLSHPGGLIDTDTGKIAVRFSSKKNVELLCELHCQDTDALKTAKSVTTNSKGEWVFDLDMPTTGEYSLNVFARDVNDTSRIYNVHTYLIQSAGYGNQTKGSREDDGDSSDDDTDGAQNSTVATETVETADNEILIPVPQNCKKAVAAVHRKNANDPPSTDQIQFIKQDDSQFVKVELKEYGEYMLNLYDVDEGGRVTNIAKYQINKKPGGELYDSNINNIMETVMGDEANKQASKDTVDEAALEAENAKKSEEERRKLARKQVQKALDLKDFRQLKTSLARYDALQPNKDDDMLVKAKKTLALFQAKNELTDATHKRSLIALEEAIKKAKSVNFDRSLDLQISMATKLRDRIARIEKLRSEVLAMEQKTISELRTYSKPPDGIHQTLTATFLLLGHDFKELKEWRSIQILLGKTGKDSFMRKISYFDPKTVRLATARAAKKAMKNFSLDQIRTSSAGAATFYIWNTGMIDEVESMGGLEATNRLRL